MNINDVRFKLIVDNIKEAISKGNPFSFKIDRETYQSIGFDFFKLINEESCYNYGIEVKPDSIRSHFIFSSKFRKLKGHILCQAKKNM